MKLLPVVLQAIEAGVITDQELLEVIGPDATSGLDGLVDKAAERIRQRAWELLNSVEPERMGRTAERKSPRVKLDLRAGEALVWDFNFADCQPLLRCSEAVRTYVYHVICAAPWTLCMSAYSFASMGFDSTCDIEPSIKVFLEARRAGANAKDAAKVAWEKLLEGDPEREDPTSPDEECHVYGIGSQSDFEYLIGHIANSYSAKPRSERNPARPAPEAVRSKRDKRAMQIADFVHRVSGILGKFQIRGQDEFQHPIECALMSFHPDDAELAERTYQELDRGNGEPHGFRYSFEDELDEPGYLVSAMIAVESTHLVLDAMVNLK